MVDPDCQTSWSCNEGGILEPTDIGGCVEHGSCEPDDDGIRQCVCDDGFSGDATVECQGKPARHEYFKNRGVVCGV